jgi:hypothetical protein
MQTPPQTPSDGPWILPIGRYMRRVRSNGEVVPEPDDEDEGEDQRRSNPGMRKFERGVLPKRNGARAGDSYLRKA